MGKIEVGALVALVLAIIGGALYLGQMDGRLKALEKFTDLSKLDDLKTQSLDEINNAKVKGLEAFGAFDVRLEELESNLVKPREPSQFITPAIGRGGSWGNWTGPKFCPVSHYVCGLEQRVESKQGSDDDTGVTGIRFSCCPL